MSRLVLIDGNSIMNRAFYGIMGSKMLTTADGTYTNAVYGFLTILFKIQEDLNPDYLAVTFDLKGPTKRHELYEGYKANRHGMPDELAIQMPIIKDVLRAMNIKIVEKQGFEGDDILGTLSKIAEKDGIDVTNSYLKGAEKTLKIANDENIKVAILKKNSPSCGSQKIYDGTFSNKLIKGDGITAKILKKNGIVVLDEDNYLEYKW